MAEGLIVKCLYRSREVHVGGIAGLALRGIWSSRNQSRQNMLSLLDKAFQFHLLNFMAFCIVPLGPNLFSKC